MKVFLPVTLFFVVITAEGNLRGEHSHGDNLPRSLKKCKNMMGDRKSNVLGRYGARKDVLSQCSQFSVVPIRYSSSVPATYALDANRS
jgi:hypothetical protein